MENKKQNFFIAGLFISLGLIISATIISKTLIEIKSSERVVKVKGLATREVDANLVIWPITCNEVSNNLKSINTKLLQNKKTIIDFLVAEGFQLNEISVATPQIKDNQATEYYSNNKNPYRYFGKLTVTLRSNKVQKAKESMLKVNKLIDKNIVIAPNNYEHQIEFIYTELNKIKPAMIEEATINARKSADKFAKDSGSELGKIKTANQGQFSILNRDRNTPDKKIVRVVSTIVYYLED